MCTPELPPGDPKARGSRHRHPCDRRWLLITLVIYCVLVLRIVGTRHYWPRYDSGAFISAAVSLARGLGLRDITSPVGKPEQVWSHTPTWVQHSPGGAERPDWPASVQYPPLLSLLLAPLVSLGGGRYVVLQLLPILSGALALLAVYWWRYELLPGPWRAVLILTAGSMATLYATRVQSEAVHLPLVIVAFVLLSRVRQRPERTMLYGLGAALVLLVAAAIHTKVVFICGAAGLWLLFCARAPFARRAVAAAVLWGLTIIPIALWMHHATWAGRQSTSPNPYLLNDGWDPASTSTLSPSGVLVVASRAVRAGAVCLQSLAVFFPIHGAEWLVGVRPISSLLAPSLLFYALILLGWRAWHKVGGGVVAWCVAGHFAGCMLSPWGSPRMMVPVAPFVVYALAVGLLGLVGRLCEPGGRLQRQLPAAIMIFAGCMQCVNWIKLAPEHDEWCIESHRDIAAIVDLAQQLPERRVVLVAGDNYSFALVTGHATISLTPAEWKQSHLTKFLAAGGVATMIAPSPKDPAGTVFSLFPHLSPWADRLSTETLRLDGAQWLVAQIGLPLQELPRELLDASPELPTRIHPRWLQLTRADADAIWKAAFPDE